MKNKFGMVQIFGEWQYVGNSPYILLFFLGIYIVHLMFFTAYLCIKNKDDNSLFPYLIRRAHRINSNAFIVTTFCFLNAIGIILADILTH